MRASITTELLRKLPLQNVDIRDTKLTGFILRCRASGHHSFRVEVGRGRRVTIGTIDKFTVDEARKEARNIIGQVWHGRDPIAEKRAAKTGLTLEQFVEQHYEPWALQHQKRGTETVRRIKTGFAAFLPMKLSEVTPWHVEKWRTGRLKQGAKPTTVNDYVTLLKSVLKKAVTWKALMLSPIADVRPVQSDKTGRIRYLSVEEEKSLRAALEARDAIRRDRRDQANIWRRDRGYAEYPADSSDHLTPIVLLALNTGMRRGEIFNLRWSDVDLMAVQVTIRGEDAKTGQTRYIPLNAEALKALQGWRGTADTHEGYVFPGRGDSDDGRLDNVKKAWLPVVREAKITGFRFHDLRHTFASKLVMKGVDLNTVRELLGHADIKMTLRYAHLAPEHKARIVPDFGAADHAACS
jgi:integrase